MAKLTFVKNTNFRTPTSKKKIQSYSIAIPTTKESKIIQNYLFKRDFHWSLSDKTFHDILRLLNKDTPAFLDLNIFNAKQITWSSESPFARLITFQDLKKLYP